MFLLLLEGEHHLRSYLHKSLSREGYSVASYTNKSDIYTLISQRDLVAPSVVLMDQVLADGKSDELIPLIKTKWPDTPLMVLSELNDPHVKSVTLDQGADDCMSKPFSLEELAARLRVLRRRIAPAPKKILALGNTQIDYDQQVAFVGNQKINLCRKEFLLLQLLMEHPTKMYSKFHLLDQVWNIHTEVESNVVEVTIRNLRKKLDAACSSLHIDSRRNVGYCIEPQTLAILQ